MAFKLRQRQLAAPGPGWVFNPPPGWPAPPDGFPAPAGEIHLSCDGQPHAFPPGTPVRIGRATNNDVMVGDPSVSRKHAQLTWSREGWVFENVGQAPTFQGGQSVTRVAVTQPVELTLGSANGPVLRIEPAPAPAPQPPGAPPAPGPAFPPGQPGPAFQAGQPGPGFLPGQPGPAFPPGQLGPPVPAVPQASQGDDLADAFRILIPVGSWLKNPGWRQGLRLLVIAYALLPLIF